MKRRLLRWIWRLYPPRWRARFRDELELYLSEDESRDRAPPAPTWADVRDALSTLPRTWVSEPGTAWSADLRSAWRSISRAPGHAALVVCTLALALGVNAAVFSVSWAVLFRSLPYEAPEQLIRVQPSPVGPEWGVQQAFVESPGVEGAAAYVANGGANLVDADDATRLSVTQVDASFFDVLGVDAALGRFIGSESDGVPEVVLSWQLWRGAFGADREVLGRTVRLSGHAATIVGVAPAGANFPSGTDLWVSLPALEDFYSIAFAPDAVARLASPEATGPLAAAMRERLEVQWEAVPDFIPMPEVRFTPIRDEMVGAVRGPLLTLLGSAAVILLLGCVNLAGIQVARLIRRSGEFRVRQALGADRGRLLLQLGTELLILSGAAGLAALFAGGVLARVLATWLPARTHGIEAVELNAPVLLFMGAATGISALVIGTLLAWSVAGRSGGPGWERTTSPDRTRTRLQGGLLVVQVTLAIVLAFGAGLLGRSLTRLASVPLGYEPAGVLTFGAHLPADAYPNESARELWVARVEDALAALPGVEAVGVTTRLPYHSGAALGFGFKPEGAQAQEEAVGTSWFRATPGYFQAMGIQLLAGTLPVPSASDPEGEIGGVVLGRTAALRLFGDADPLGRGLQVEGREGVPARVVGVVEDVRLRGRGNDVRPVAILAWNDAGTTSPNFALRVRGDPGAIIAGVRQTLADVDPTVPAADLRAAEDVAAEELAAPRAVTILTGLFGATALLLVGLGLHGMVSQWVQARRRELGIRLALGARSGQVVRSMVARALGLVLVGVAIGVPGALVLARFLRSLLYEVDATDPMLMGIVVVVVIAAGAVTATLPALRAARIPASESLQAE